MKLYPYQEIGRDFLANRETACLWDEPGLGKSFQSLSAAKQQGVKNAIIICPASVRMVWKSECEKVNLDCHTVTSAKQVSSGINIVSYEGASGACFDNLRKIKSDLLICDEGHYLKTAKAKRTKKIYGRSCTRDGGLAEKADRVWSLTGTPMPNNPSELWPTMRALFPDAITTYRELPMTYWQFVNRYCTTMNNGFGIQITGGKNLHELRDRLRGRILRRKKEEVLTELPGIRYHTLPVNGDLKGVDPSESELVLECLGKDDPLGHLKKIGTHVASLRKITGLAKVDAVVKWVREAGFDKIVLFAHHRDVIEKLKVLEDNVHIDGSSSLKQREAAVDKFQNGDARVFIGQLQAAGTGLTLTAASVVLFVESSWVPAENRQAADRIHRIGQKDGCLVYFAMIPKSIDENIIRVVKRKTETYKEMGL